MVWKNQSQMSLQHVNSLKWNSGKTKDIVTKQKSIVNKTWVLSEEIDSKRVSTKETLMEMWWCVTHCMIGYNNVISWNCTLKFAWLNYM